MRAITQNEFGGQDVLTLPALPKPTPLPTAVLVRVHKPHAPLPGIVRDVCFELRRERA